MADDADGAFTSYATATVDGLLELQPEWATGVGDHRHDDRLTVGTAGHYEQASRWAGERLAGLAAIGSGSLSPEHRVDAQILANQLARLQFMIDELREHEWNPMVANPGRAIYNLLARDYAPLADRLRCAGGRREGFREPRLGADLFSRKLRLVLDTELPVEQILARAEADLARMSGELAAAAAELTGAPARDEGATVRAALDSLAADAPDDATILDFVRVAFGAQRDFVTAHDLVTVFDDPVEVIAMPEIDRGVAVAYCDSPGPLETAALPTFIAVSPTPEGWTQERVRSFYREYNRHMIHNIMIHEAMPGHALQLQHSRRFTAASPVRTAWRSGSFVEGWAVYAEQVMNAHGYPGEGNPAALRTQRLKAKIRSVINAIMDTRVHCLGMTEPEAMALMTGPGHQEEGEAAGKWRRVLLTSAQLSTYYVGFLEVSGLADDLRREHPDWPERRLHDAMLAHASPPARHLRTLLGARAAA